MRKQAEDASKITDVEADLQDKEKDKEADKDVDKTKKAARKAGGRGGEGLGSSEVVCPQALRRRRRQCLDMGSNLHGVLELHVCQYLSEMGHGLVDDSIRHPCSVGGPSHLVSVPPEATDDSDERTRTDHVQLPLHLFSRQHHGACIGCNRKLILDVPNTQGVAYLSTRI